MANHQALQDFYGMLASMAWVQGGCRDVNSATEWCKALPDTKEFKLAFPMSFLALSVDVDPKEETEVQLRTEMARMLITMAWDRGGCRDAASALAFLTMYKPELAEHAHITELFPKVFAEVAKEKTPQ